jgi:hypothetical protein
MNAKRDNPMIPADYKARLSTTHRFVQAVEAAAAAKLDECKVQACEFTFEHEEGQPDVQACIRIELGKGIRAMVEYVPADVVAKLAKPEEAAVALVRAMTHTLDEALPYEQAWLKEGR